VLSTKKYVQFAKAQAKMAKKLILATAPTALVFQACLGAIAPTLRISTT
jgi:hypothetical protein